MSCCQHGYLWYSLVTPPHCWSLLAGSQGYIPYLHGAAVCKFELVVLLLLGHMGGIHMSTSLMSSSLVLQQCPACTVRLTLIIFVMGDRWPYSWCFVGCCLQDLFNMNEINQVILKNLLWLHSNYVPYILRRNVLQLVLFLMPEKFYLSQLLLKRLIV